MIKFTLFVALALLIAAPVYAQSAAPLSSKEGAKVFVASTNKVPAKQPKAAKKSLLPDPVDTADLTDEQLRIAEQVFTGVIACDLNAQVKLTANVPTPGRFLLQVGDEQQILTPAVTTTGAVRLESKWSGAVWIQVANKSMLINDISGTRLADGCMHQEQAAVAQRMTASAGLIE